MISETTCLICNRSFTTPRGLSRHIGEKHCTKEQYYRRFSPLIRDTCIICGKPVKFKSIFIGFATTCSPSCKNINIWKNRTEEEKQKIFQKISDTEQNFSDDKKFSKNKKISSALKYYHKYTETEEERQKRIQRGIEAFNKFWANITEEELKKIEEKRKNTNLQRYKVTNTYQLPEVVEKAQSNQSKEKKKQTMLRNWGVATNLERAEVKEKCFSEDSKLKRERTSIEKYGTPQPSQSEQIRNKISNTVKSEECQRKTKQTNLERYGSETYCNVEKIKKTKLERYGDENYCNLEKALQTKRLNNSLNCSKPENDFYEFLLTLFDENDIFRDYNKDIRYPYHVDFYIRPLDMFIELNLTWYHCFHYFDETNNYDIEKLNKMKEKAKTHNSYAYAIKVWTIKDLEKRDIAIKNNLNYIVLWDSKDIMEFKEKLHQDQVINREEKFNDIFSKRR